jgi:class 3 adenylate cyclase
VYQKYPPATINKTAKSTPTAIPAFAPELSPVLLLVPEPGVWIAVGVGVKTGDSVVVDIETEEATGDPITDAIRTPFP